MKKYFFLSVIVVLALCAYSNISAQSKASNDKYGQALIQGAFSCDLNKVENAISKKANINQKGEKGFTALMVASQKGCYEIVELLLKNKANVNLKDDNDNTALHHAATWNRADIVKLLIQYKADVFNKNLEGKTPLDDAYILVTGGDYNPVIDMLKSAMENKGKLPTKAITKTGSNDPEFEQFWNEFKVAFIAKDKNKLTGMIQFPLLICSIGNWGEEYYDLTEEKMEWYDNFYYHPEIIKTLKDKTVKTVSTKLKKDGEFTSVSFSERKNEDGTPVTEEIIVGKALRNGQEIKEIKINIKKQKFKYGSQEVWYKFVFSKINGKYMLVMVDDANIESS